MDLDYLKNTFQTFQDRTYRSGQEEVIDFILQSEKRFIVVEAPTGAGKSLIGMCAAADQRFPAMIYAVHSKALQSQLNDDFPEAVILYGRDNYACLNDPGDPEHTCASCTHTKTRPCLNRYQCLYLVKKDLALDARFKVLNYSLLLSEANYVGRFSKNDLIVIDEADALDKILYDFISIVINNRQLKKLQIGLPQYKTACENGILDWKQWAAAVVKALRGLALSHTIEIESWQNIEAQWQLDYMKEQKQIINLFQKFTIFLKYVDKDWIFEERDTQIGSNLVKNFIFKPLWLNEAITEFFLWRHSAKFVLMSATFPPPEVLSKVLGIPRGEIDYTSVPAQFPVENRKVLIVPVADMTYKKMNEEIPKVLEAVKLIVKSHPGVKGLIHTVSYRLAQEIMALGSKRFITHGPRDKIEKLEFFRQSLDPLIFVSPSSERGISLDDDLCRFIILCKAPFLSLADKGVKLRVYSGQIGQLWYISDMLLTVVQALGRGNRSMTDYCTSYLLDFQIDQAIVRKPLIIPEWFRDAIEWEEWEDFKERIET